MFAGCLPENCQAGVSRVERRTNAGAASTGTQMEFFLLVFLFLMKFSITDGISSDFVRHTEQKYSKYPKLVAHVISNSYLISFALAFHFPPNKEMRNAAHLFGRIMILHDDRLGIVLPFYERGFSLNRISFNQDFTR